MTANENFFDESTEQSRIKALIIRDYFWAWTRVILASLGPNKRIAYIDLFAGPGRYKDGTKSTPILVLESAIADPKMVDRLVTVFNDANAENTHNLRNEINALPGIGKLKFKPQIANEEVGEELARRLDEMRLVPTLLFMDPWGYKGLSLGLINAVLKNWGCDCVFFFNYNRINMGLGNEAVEEHINVLFGKDRADKLRGKLATLHPREREAAILEALIEALQEMGATYVLPFCFKDENGARTSHHLIFATKHPLGYHIMKEIMAKFSSLQHQGVATLSYCPASAIHPVLFELNRPLDDLEGMLLSDFEGQSLTAKEIFEKHSIGKPYILKNYKHVLLDMEAKHLVATSPPKEKRRKNTFADTVRVSFPKRKQGNDE